MPGKKLVILAAVNGGAQQSHGVTHVPTSPAEIAEAAYHCYKAGASVVHVHARAEDKGPTGDPRVFSEIISRIRDKCDILIQTTNGIGVRKDPETGAYVWPTDEERMGLVSIEPKQDLFSLAGGSWDFYHPDGGYEDMATFVNSPELLRKNIKAVLATGAALEFEITEVSFLYKLRRFAEEGVFDAENGRFWLDYCMGFGAMPATARTLALAVEDGQRIFPNARWEVLATGRDQFPMNSMGVAMGCDIVRVGFEDNIFLPDGSTARHNYELVDAMAKISGAMGREPASVAEARAVFGIGNTRH